MKEESERTKYSHMVEELEKYKNAVEECKKNLTEKKKQVSYIRAHTLFDCASCMHNKYAKKK